jgi:hypothetical protein
VLTLSPAVTFVGENWGTTTDATSLGYDGVYTSVQDGDWLFQTIFWGSATSVTFDATGWSLVGEGIGSRATLRVWTRQWHTGDPTGWTTSHGTLLLHTGMVWCSLFGFRLTAGPSTLHSAVHVTTTHDGYIDPIASSQIKAGDVAFAFGIGSDYAVGHGAGSTYVYEAGYSGAIGSGYPSDLIMSHVLPAAGVAPGGSFIGSGSDPMEVYALQWVLPSAVPPPPPPPPPPPLAEPMVVLGSVVKAKPRRTENTRDSRSRQV